MLSKPDMTADDLLLWNETSATKWRDFINANLAILALPCDIRESSTVAQALQHIVAVELRFAQRLAAQPESDYAAVKFSTADDLYATHQRALDTIRTLLADPAYDWSVEIEFTTVTAGKLRATRQAIFIHLLMHSIRHYAQLATLVRQHGFKPNWPMDYLYLSMQRV